MVWTELDDAFSNSYFERAWIVQEVAAAVEVNVFRGRSSMPWSVFWAAYLGRQIFAFKPHMASDSDASNSAIWSVRDTRERFRDPRYSSDLASILATFTYSKETRPHDHIYAALKLVKTPPIPRLLNNPCNQSIEELFVNVASFIIKDRNDLYLWGNKSVLGQRVLRLPTWVPEWTGHTNDYATEFFNHMFSRLIPGNYSISEGSLHLDAHIIDRIELVSPLMSGDNIGPPFQLVRDLNSFFKRRNSSLFGKYVGQDLKRNHVKPLPAATAQDQRLHNLANAFAILASLRECPNMLLGVLSDLRNPHPNRFDDESINIEAFWSTMNPIARLRSSKPIPCGERLFLGWLYIRSLMGPGEGSIRIAGLPKGYESWIKAALVLESANREFLSNLCVGHLSRSIHLELEEECMFVTRKGYFGRAPAGEIRQGHVVAILGGGWVPYILEGRGERYALVSHAYVEGLMDLKKLPTSMKIQRIELV
jgi:hypothetical protein